MTTGPLTFETRDGGVIQFVRQDDGELAVALHRAPSAPLADHVRVVRGRGWELELQLWLRQFEPATAKPGPPVYGPQSLVYTAAGGQTIDLARADLSELQGVDRALAEALVRYAAPRLGLDVP
jgi:hypothetical protein